MKMIQLSSRLEHYAGLCAVFVVAYFCLVNPFIKMETKIHGSGSQVVATQPGPTTSAQHAADVAAEVAKNQAILAAIKNEEIQLSAAQLTVANAISAATGANAKFAGALAAGLTQPAPKVQVITVSTSKTGKTSAVASASDSQIQKDLKAVLNDPKTKVHIDTKVTVSWADKPFSPVFAAYTNDGASGIGYTVIRGKILQADALGLVTSSKKLEAGVGVEHIIKGTSAGIGVDAVYDFGTQKIKSGIYAAIHF